MSKQKAIDKIDRALGVFDKGSHEYERLKNAMFNWFDARELEEFADFVKDEN